MSGYGKSEEKAEKAEAAEPKAPSQARDVTSADAPKTEACGKCGAPVAYLESGALEPHTCGV